ncbi:hypothetical protein L1O03_00750 [Corynebacterium uropygiale]|uniref:Uncharacterized protein n=1 Tax=Corynebacterium uropygiale TaxID=1775911 RepID=A0A9X1QQ12_9CORY|nr:hypothetical protein [Corynebacterium uropygiale]MCF4005708.1 hypothetical protein [Corynebacterium uropygiale]
MTRATAFGYNDTMDADARQALRRQLAEQRLDDLRGGRVTRGGGVVDPLPEDAPPSSAIITPTTRRSAGIIRAP